MNERSVIRLRVHDSATETVAVEFVAQGCVRLMETPLTSALNLYAGDTIDVHLQPDGSHAIGRLVQRALSQHFSWLVPRGWTETSNAQTYLTEVAAAGGHHEVLVGGLLVVHLPLESGFDAEAELDRYLSADWPEA